MAVNGKRVSPPKGALKAMKTPGPASAPIGYRIMFAVVGEEGEATIVRATLCGLTPEQKDLGEFTIQMRGPLDFVNAIFDVSKKYAAKLRDVAPPIIEAIASSA
jgi:hypothetical protein